MRNSTKVAHLSCLPPAAEGGSFPRFDAFPFGGHYAKPELGRHFADSPVVGRRTTAINMPSKDDFLIPREFTNLEGSFSSHACVLLFLDRAGGWKSCPWMVRAAGPERRW